MNLDKIISLALEEDSVHNDITSKNIISKNMRANAVLIAKCPGIVCGIDVFKKVFLKLNKSFTFDVLKEDGLKVKKGDIILTMEGPAYHLLCGERTALNFIQKLSGIATTTNQFANIVKNTTTHIYDTRKTIPGFRHLSKYAVRCGGGKNHRMCLEDMVLIKDNHLKLIDVLTKKVQEIRKKHKGILIQVECENKKHVQDALNAKVDLIMLDNMKKEQLVKMIKFIRKNSTEKYKPQIEISGGVNLKTIKEFAKLGIDRISIGMLTHSAPSLDISLKIKVQK
ncbi:carboxylating nicotinate-nucleotide diphosphorylase [Elusimicrobiota bacterium]